MDNKTKKTNNNINPLLLFFVKWGTVVLFLIIVITVYYFVFYKRSLRYEHFEDINVSKISKSTTIYEESLNKLFFNNPILICNLLPTASSACVINGESMVKNKFPVHIIKLIDGSILSVFNDGRLYSKNDILNTIWDGPLDNSLINNSIALRMITLNSDASSILGVGYDNKLYSRDLDVNGSFDSNTVWKPIANNNNIIYVIFDRTTHNLVSIDVNGKLYIKKTNDLTSKNEEVNNTSLDRPLLRLYYDVYGYMLAIDNKFELYQFKDKDWKTSPLNLERGSNKSRLNDIIYYNDGKLLGLVFDEENTMLVSSKQSDIYYLSPFNPINEIKQELIVTNNFMLTDTDIIISKNGFINQLLLKDDQKNRDEDTSFAYNKQSLENQSKLRSFCKARYDTTSASQEENYELLSNVEKNNERLKLLKGILDNLIKYDPDKKQIQESVIGLSFNE